jgi:hypothetical protein
MREHIIKRQADTLDYLKQMLGELRTMAEAEQYDMLAYLIEMAYIEANDIIRGHRPSRIQDDQRDGTTPVPLQATRKI